MNEEQSADLTHHLEKELKELEVEEEKTRWNFDNIISSNRDLLLVSEGLNSDDAQSKLFCEFIAAATVFASKDLKDKVSNTYT